MTKDNNCSQEQDLLDKLLKEQGCYKIVQLLGKGGFGTTWEIDDQGEPKVLKVLHDQHHQQSEVIRLFKQEAKVLSQLSHPGIPKVESDGYFTLPQNSENPAFYCLVMEKIEGQNLEDWLTNNANQPITQNQAIAWLKQLAEILTLVHGQKWFHRDIKPSNIMLRPSGDLVLIDFGAAREVTGTYLKSREAGNITYIESPGFTPWEQKAGQAEYKSDFFALGRSFIYLLTGKNPYGFGEDPVTGKFEENWRDSAPQISDLLADLIDDLIIPLPEQRPQDAKDIVKRLENIINRLEIIDIESCVFSILPELNKVTKFFLEPILRNELRQWAKQSRIPKIALYGRTGAGKSSLVNAIMGEQVAEVRLEKSQTMESKSYTYQRNGRKLEIVDSRGVGENTQGDPAFEKAINYIVQEKVDILLFVIPAKERGYVAQDLGFLTTLRQKHQQIHNTRLPIILVINQIDVIEPARQWSPPYNLNLESQVVTREPSNAREQKEINIIKCIQARLSEYRELTNSYVPVSACWQEYEDTRYNIEQLELQIYNNIADDTAKYAFGGVTSGKLLKKAIASKLKLTAASFILGAKFVPFATKFIQNLLVRMIVKIANPDKYQSITVEDFLEQLGVQPTQVNANAVAMTLAIGEAAISYFIEGCSIEVARKAFVQEEERRQTKLRDAQPEDVIGILQEIDREISERYGIPPLYGDDSEKYRFNLS